MPNNPNKLSQFWQELKRRKVTRVITIYAAAAFVILELTDIVAPSLGLPDWTLNFIIILLCVGFIITVIVSWIYDIHPEGGIVKTEPAEKVKAEDMPESSNSWRIASYISFVVIVALIVLNIIPRGKQSEEIRILEKSIAVLPFINDSPDEENAYFINGTMEAILDNLCKIEDIRVVGRTSVEQYRNAPKPIPVIADEMNVRYILEGSGQKDGNKVRLTLQLIDGINDQHLWSSPYIREIEMGQIFDLQSEIAQLVASEIEAIITPEEKQLIEKIPTANLTAYDFYQKGKEEYYDYFVKGDLEALKRADDLFHKALEIDSKYAQALVGLANVYWQMQDDSEYFTENYIDSVLILANLALSFDKQSSEAYILRGRYYSLQGKGDLALADFEKALRVNPNNGEAYIYIAIFYSYADFVKAIDNNHKAISVDRGQELNLYFLNLAWEYFIAGFSDKAYHYNKEALNLDGDSAYYYYSLSEKAFFMEDYNESIEYARKAIELGGTRAQLYLASSLLQKGKYKESLEAYENWMKYLEEIGDISLNNTQRIAYAYWKNGLIEEAEFYFDKQIEYSLGLIDLNRPWAQNYFPYYDLAGVYAFRGEKEKAYEYLRLFNQIEGVPYWMSKLIKRDELFDSIRDEPEFQQIVREVEAKYQAEHERVRLWLEENDML